jgi:hypothetical protein
VTAIALGMATPVLPGGRDVPDQRYIRNDTPPPGDSGSNPFPCRGERSPAPGAGIGAPSLGRDTRTRLEVLFRRLLELLAPRPQPPTGCPS